MPDIDRDTLRGEIDGLEQRMGSRFATVRTHSELAQLRGQLTRLSQRHRNLRNRFEAAQGAEWDSAKNELAREHGELYQEFVRFEQKLDSRQRERPHSGRAPGAKSGLV
jgi:hypothetical protein